MSAHFSITQRGMAMNKRTTYRLIKRAFDLTASAALLGLTAPLLAAVSAVVRMESKGSSIYIHERIGLDGKRIRVLKFRSMKAGSDDVEAVLTDEEVEAYYREYKLKNDPRVTEIGRWLRRSSMDELPQLFNVLQGGMSLVGPRPVTAGELDFYTEDERQKLLSVKPGITGYWQINGRDNATYESGKRQQMEIWYAENASLLLDALIILKTPAAVIKGRGAY